MLHSHFLSLKILMLSFECLAGSNFRNRKFGIIDLRSPFFRSMFLALQFQFRAPYQCFNDSRAESLWLSFVSILRNKHCLRGKKCVNISLLNTKIIDSLKIRWCKLRSRCFINFFPYICKILFDKIQVFRFCTTSGTTLKNIFLYLI